MLVDINRSRPMNVHDYPSLPAAGSGLIRRFRAGEVELLFEKAPVCASGDDLSYIHYSLLALYDGRLYCAVSAESLDLRSLALSLGTSVKEVQRDYGTKGFLSEPVLVIYGDGQREELGPVSVELKEEFILPLLMDYILDSLDIPDDPVPLN